LNRALVVIAKVMGIAMFGKQYEIAKAVSQMINGLNSVHDTPLNIGIAQVRT
jgi:hypothetical protein